MVKINIKKDKFPSFALQSIYSTNVSGAEQIPETNNFNQI